ncbi:MAG: glycosyltransferase family 4 protein [Planctomycetes bacterium]|nr:glycosyltransferase family 4 protein [Planctomycetota bacterium]
MKLLLIEPAHGSEARGNATTVSRWHRALSQRGHEVVVSKPQDAERSISERRPDLIHAHHALHCGRDAIVLGTRNELPVVVSLGGTDIRGGPGGRPKPEAFDVFREATALLGPFPQDGELLDDCCPGHAPFFRVRRGLDLRQLPEVSVHPPDGSVKLLFSGGLRAVKNPLRALDWLDALRSAGLDAHLTLAGPVIDEELSKDLEARSRPGIVELRGSLSATAMPALYAEHDILVNSSESEGCANAILEAWRAGLAVAATLVSGNRELLAAAPARVARLLDPVPDPGRDWLDFARAIAGESSRERQARGRLAQDQVGRHHDVEDELAELLAAYRSVLAD